MRLVEVVAGARSSERGTRGRARRPGEAMGKTVIAAQDVAGFLVNRANRPFSLESLKLLEERIAEPAAIDRALVLGAGFPMGPFALMDLVGIDVNHAVAESFQRQSYGEPRYRPSPLAARKVAAGDLGRKTGRGWYEYPRPKPLFPEPPEPTGGGDLDGARERGRASASTSYPAAASWRWCEDDAHGRASRRVGHPARASCRALRGRPRPDHRPGRLPAHQRGVLLRSARGTGPPRTSTSGMTVGLNHPMGPFARLEQLGADRVVATLDALHRELGEERYRVAPLLRRMTR